MIRINYIIIKQFARKMLPKKVKLIFAKNCNISKYILQESVK